MASGVEVAGIALAVLPLLIEGAKSYRRGVDSLINVSSNTRRDYALKKEYNQLWWELYFLNKRLQNVVVQLPDLCGDCRNRLRSASSLEEWEDNEAVRSSLLAYFGGEEDDLNAFTLVLANALSSIDQLVHDQALQLSKKEQDSGRMYDRIKGFATLRQDDTIKGHFRDRFRFFKDSERRAECLASLNKWNTHLGEMLSSPNTLESVNQNSLDVKVGGSHMHVPSLEEGRQIFRALTSVAQLHWDCPCSSTHEAMLCLDVKPLSTKNSSRTVDFLVRRSPSSANPEFWLEGRFKIQKIGADNTMEVFEFTNLCDILDEEDQDMVHLLVEVSASSQCHTLKQLRPGPHRFRWLNKEVPLTLHEILERRELRSLRDKRTIALAFAYAVLQFHGNDCISETLQKEAIFFYALTESMLDYSRPFMKTDFQRLCQANAPSSLKVLHRNPAILNLGILLIELDKGVLFASLRDDTTKKRTLNQDLFAARKLMATIEYPEYRDAVRACLETSWVQAGRKVDLNENEVAGGFVQSVIEPLKKELEWLCNM